MTALARDGPGVLLPGPLLKLIPWAGADRHAPSGLMTKAKFFRCSSRFRARILEDHPAGNLFYGELVAPETSFSHRVVVDAR